MRHLAILARGGKLTLPACTVGPNCTRPVVGTPAADVTIPADLRDEADGERLFSVPRAGG